jgi:hypothetical protein
LTQNLVHQRQHTANVIAAGQFWHHAPIGLMHLDLAVQGVRKQARRAGQPCIHQGDTSFVAGRLDTQYQHAASVRVGKAQMLLHHCRKGF